MILFLLGVFCGAMGVGTFALITVLGEDDYEEWCGCDGQGMAHTPGASGFACAVAAPPDAGKAGEK